ncbi:MAG TPA: FHA domain-containing protein, partial [Ktedonobacteraceae bacterium]|nr:FHA domain-containing protein [Ktedonobacteraceae bacterium]
MTTNALDFPSWFSDGCYIGLVCCMVAIMVNALHTAWRKRGTTRQLATSLVCCVTSALLLLPAILWFNVRFSSLQASASALEIALMLVYVSLWGLVVPFSSTAVFCLYTQPRDSNTSFRIPRPRSKRTTVGNAASIPAASAAGVPANLPHRLPDRPAPFVYSEDQPWGWLTHRNGRFQGQRLALKRNVITIGREEDNDIWLDDETSSRYHAELAWMNDQPYVTDCNSLNGILLNGRRMRGTLALAHGDFVEIGAHRFLFESAPRPVASNELDDPLLPHRRRPLSVAPLSDMPDGADLYVSEPLPVPPR